MYPFIEVRYRNDARGSVDDVTLGELIESKRIKSFYRPSERRWVNVYLDRIRGKGETNIEGFLRRASDQQDRGTEKAENEQALPCEISAQEWFDKGFVTLHTSDDCEGAVRAFALSVRLNPNHARAYVSRALAYERLGNVQQAVEDYSKVITLTPDDPKVYYLRGLALRRVGMGDEAIEDLKRAADMRYRPAFTFLKSMGITF
jgi:tetratricopeptide (TPR) repeat protein